MTSDGQRPPPRLIPPKQRGAYYSRPASQRNRMGSRDAPVRAEDVLRLALKKHNIDRELDRYRFVLHWRDIVGEDVARRATPECFKGDVLFVRVTNSAWAQELEFQKGYLMARLKGYLASDCAIKDIHFLVEGRRGFGPSGQASMSSTASSRRFTTPKTR